MSTKRPCVSVCVQAQTTLTTNDIVISKLTQILSYLRQGTRNKKLKKRDKGRSVSHSVCLYVYFCLCNPVSSEMNQFLLCI